MNPRVLIARRALPILRRRLAAIITRCNEAVSAAAWWRPVAGTLGCAIAAAVAFEGASAALVHCPALVRLLPIAAQRVSREAYARRPTRVFQMEDMTRYDSELGYTLKPGRFLFADAEFAVPFEVNRLGLRDSEAAAEKPEIIVLGDSYAMGWGVPQEEALAKRLERLTGLKTLNAAIASYGTARQLRLLDRLDTRRLRYLVIQYCDNDIRENAQFREFGHLIQVSSASYRERVASQNPGYIPWSYARQLVKTVFRLHEGLWPNMSPRTPAAPLDLFYSAFAATRTNLSGVQLIVCEADYYGADRWLIPLLANDTRRRGHGLPGFLRRLRFVRLSSELTDADRYVMDEHWRASAHELASRKIGTVIMELETARNPLSRAPRSATR